MQQEGAAVIPAVAGLRHQDEIGFQVHDRLERGETTPLDAEIAAGVGTARRRTGAR